MLHPRTATDLPLISLCALAGVAGAFVGAAPVAAQSDSDGLAAYFGFEPARIIVGDDGFGPIEAGDVNGDGLTDLIVANNRKSRIEVHLQRAEPLGETEANDRFRVNRLPPSPYYARVDLSVAHRVLGMRLHDVTDDGRLDIIYTGSPGEIVVLEQTEAAPERVAYEEHSSRRMRGLVFGQAAIDVASVQGDDNPELLVIADSRVNIFDLTSEGIVGEPRRLGSSDGLYAMFVEDFNGDGRLDVMGALPDDESPLRLWLQSADASGQGELGPEIRFEMPVLFEAEPVRHPDRSAASIAVIERTSRRIVLYDIVTKAIDKALSEPGRARQQDVTAEVHALRGGADRERSVILTDLNADGLFDLIATDREGNAITVHLQTSAGLSEPQMFSAFKSPKAVAAGPWDPQKSDVAVFVLSEEEKTVGVSQWANGRLSFPQPVTVATGGATPVAIAYINPNASVPPRVAEPLREPYLAVVVRDKRDHVLELHRADGQVRTIELEGVDRPPQSMLAGDFDGDLQTDLALFTPNEPMVMVEGLDRAWWGSTADQTAEGAGEEDAPPPPVVLIDETMPQFGLVEAAGPTNTALLDVDDDGRMELLIADENFVRAASFDDNTGWRVLEQITMPDPRSALSALSVMQLRSGEQRIVVADTTNNDLVIIGEGSNGAWGVSDRLTLSGFEPGQLFTGAFSGDGEPNILAIAPEAFAIVRLGGDAITLEEVTAYRSDDEDRLEHEIEVADINSDGYLDLVVLDAREQMLQLFSLSASRNLVFATEFQVFESRIFTGGDRAEFEPSYVTIADVTGDGSVDLVLEVHDRMVIYPQQTESNTVGSSD